MSTCISRHGEYGNHVPDDEFVCARCNVLDEDALIEALTEARAALAERDATIADWRELVKCLDRLLVAYRTGGHPPGYVLDRIHNLRRALDGP